MASYQTDAKRMAQLLRANSDLISGPQNQRTLAAMQRNTAELNSIERRQTIRKYAGYY